MDSTPDETGKKGHPTSLRLRTSDISDAERIRKHLDLDNISQAIRRSIRMTAKQIESETQPANESDAA